MAITAHPRSVSDATRFTPTTPHAASKSATASGGGGDPPSRFAPPDRSPLQPPSGPVRRETPEQRVARLRAAHEAARRAGVSRFDRVAAVSRGVFDRAHGVTVTALISLTCAYDPLSCLLPCLSPPRLGEPPSAPPLSALVVQPAKRTPPRDTVLAGFATLYTAVDMWSRNSRRKAEFFETQRRLEADSLEAARLAYMRGDATPEQVAMVDEVREQLRAREAGAEGPGGAFKMPSILSAPAARRSDEVLPAAAAEKETPSSPPRVLSFEEKQASVADIKDRARAAFEAEKQNQKRGGPLDRVGLEEAKGGKSSWWPWSR